MEDDIKELKSVLRSLVVSSPTQVDVRTLMRDYRSMVGKPIPLAKYGYKDPVLFLKERCDDCFMLQGQSGNPVLTLIVPDTLKHIDKFVQKQKISSSKKYREKRRSIPVAALSKPTNLISATFTKKQKETKPPDQEITESEVAKKLNVDTKAKSDLLDKENDPQHSKNGTCSRSALENFMKKRIPLYDSLQYEEAEKSHNDRDSSKDDADSGRQTSSSSSSAKWTQLEELKTEIKTLIEEHPEGIWCTDLIGLYRDMVMRQYSGYGVVQF
ncbi:unnamed protein product [Parnassius apollo]|uniref:(apollo) hypothetical protein n=1 Tax=Parnassius apollo TaxID=110799 RepID=A0A8S3Y6L6_PARAO|nr:unnamed protein product [Parnassius apollo]